ncbi:hypothetical protein VNO80_26723 [Phaseolus coccineus]|uniref:Pentatricopeptide repeat-containing protein n=1 Tax=Phaseolus coccineus TaxID=3886 RepID=A0AAN9QGZ3_PHACN
MLSFRVTKDYYTPFCSFVHILNKNFSFGSESAHFSLNKGFSRVSASTQIAIAPKDTVFNLPKWRGVKNDSRAKELRVYDAFLHLEYLVGKGQKPEVTQATQLLYDLCKFNKARKAVKVMDMMVYSGIMPDAASYTYFQMLYEMTKYGFTPDSFTQSSMIRGMCREGMLDEDLKIFRILEENDHIPNIDNYSALILGFCKARRTDMSIEIFLMMVNKGCVPNENTYTILVEGLAFEEETDLAADLLKELCGK